jgi:hypothetical protein
MSCPSKKVLIPYRVKFSLYGEDWIIHRVFLHLGKLFDQRKYWTISHYRTGLSVSPNGDFTTMKAVKVAFLLMIAEYKDKIPLTLKDKPILNQ